MPEPTPLEQILHVPHAATDAAAKVQHARDEVMKKTQTDTAGVKPTSHLDAIDKAKDYKEMCDKTKALIADQLTTATSTLPSDVATSLADKLKVIFQTGEPAKNNPNEQKQWLKKVADTVVAQTLFQKEFLMAPAITTDILDAVFNMPEMNVLEDFSKLSIDTTDEIKKAYPVATPAAAPEVKPATPAAPPAAAETPAPDAKTETPPTTPTPAPDAKVDPIAAAAASAAAGAAVFTGGDEDTSTLERLRAFADTMGEDSKFKAPLIAIITGLTTLAASLCKLPYIGDFFRGSLISNKELAAKGDAQALKAVKAEDKLHDGFKLPKSLLKDIGKIPANKFIKAVKEKPEELPEDTKDKTVTLATQIETYLNEHTALKSNPKTTVADILVLEDFKFNTAAVAAAPATSTGPASGASAAAPPAPAGTTPAAPAPTAPAAAAPSASPAAPVAPPPVTPA